MALTEVDAWKVDKAQLTSYLTSNPHELRAALAYTNAILDIFVNRVNDLEHMNAYLRVASRLVSLAKRFGKPEAEGILIEAPVTQQDIAGSLAMSRESVSRELNKLIAKGTIKYHNQLIIIEDMQALENEISSYPE